MHDTTPRSTHHHHTVQTHTSPRVKYASPGGFKGFQVLASRTPKRKALKTATPLTWWWWRGRGRGFSFQALDHLGA